MGLLDFLAVKPGQQAQGKSGLVVSPTTPQNYSSTVAPAASQPAAPAPKNYTNVQYPIPTPNNQLGSTVLPEANGLTARTNSYSTESLPQFSKPVEPVPQTHNETILDNGVRQVTHSQDIQPTQQPIPAPVTPEIKPISQPSPVIETIQPVNQTNEVKPLYSYSNNPVPADVLAEQMQAQEPAPIVEALPDDLDLGSTDLNSTQLAEPQSQLDSTEPVAPLPEPVQNIQPEIKPEPKEDIIEIGNPLPTTAPVVNETPVPPITEVTSIVEEPKVETPTVEVTPEVKLPPLETNLPNTAANIIEQKLEAPPVPAAQPVVEKSIEVAKVEEPKIELSSETRPESQVEEQKIEPVVKTEVAKTSLNVLNKIAFISLNTQGVNSSLSKKVKSLAVMLKNLDVETLIDSNKGYGMDVISGMSGTKNKVSAIYLKPFYSKYSDETTLEVPLENFTKINFSNVLDRIKYLYKEATVFIVPETSGLNNLAQVLVLLNSQAMYFGSHKPVILFGTAWKDRINSLKNSFGLSQQELDSMYYASTPEEAISIINKLDAEYSNKKITNNNSIDMRDEQSEKEGILA